ncbi:hypothetical protein E4T43_04826 [Aureobasidium subglaciale]|nr:hypothetical protein E4T43_04826 [Aureobasidium subglaciale]
MEVSNTPSRTSISQHTRKCLHFLLPSFLHSGSPRYTYLNTAKPLQPTAWIDGMRGIAAFLVFVYHLAYSTHDVNTAWLADGKRDFLRLPLLRFFHHGPFMVSIFFVLSGYALSYKPMQQIKKGDVEALGKGLGSAVLRRGVRLYMPCLVSTLCIVVLVRLGCYDKTRELANDEMRLTGHREKHAWRYETLGEQMSVWSSAFAGFVNPFSGEGMYIDTHLWTITVEYMDGEGWRLTYACVQRASIILYVTQLGLGALRTRYRMLVLLCLMIWAHGVDRWEMVLFYGGFILAELDIRRSASQPFNSNSKSKIPWTAIYILTFICGLYLGGQPEREFEHAPGWTFLYSIIPSYIKDWYRYYSGWGSFLLVWSTSNSSLLQHIFTNRISQYLGRISFSLYLVHGAIIHTLHYGLLEILWSVIGTDTNLKKEIAFGCSAVCVMGMVVWVADLFMRGVDGPSVRFARWLEGKLVVKAQEKEEPAWREAEMVV